MKNEEIKYAFKEKTNEIMRTEKEVMASWQNAEDEVVGKRKLESSGNKLWIIHEILTLT